MKSIAILGMMFLSIGVFAQQRSNIKEVEKEKVCIKKSDQLRKSDKEKLSPQIHVDARKANVRRDGVVVQKRHQAKKGEVRDQKIAPLKRKNAKVDAKL